MLEVVADDDVAYALIYKDQKTGKYITVKLAAGDLKDIDAILNRLESKVLNPEILDAIRKDLALMAAEESTHPNNAANQNDTTTESPDARGGSTYYLAQYLITPACEADALELPSIQSKSKIES